MTAEDAGDWIKGRVAMIMGSAQSFYVPSNDLWLANAAGDLGLRLWAMGETKEDALEKLARFCCEHFRRELSRLHHGEVVTSR